MDAVSNVRPIAILAGYMATAILLTSFCIAVIRVRWDATAGLSSAEHARRRTAISVFSILAAISFGSTWYHMFRFFEWSYTQWAFSSVAEELLTGDPNGLHLGQWLRDTTLFKQAWASTLETPARAWWSMQIFAFCAIWSVMLAAHCEFSSLSVVSCSRCVLTTILPSQEEMHSAHVGIHASGSGRCYFFCCEPVISRIHSL